MNPSPLPLSRHLSRRELLRGAALGGAGLAGAYVLGCGGEGPPGSATPAAPVNTLPPVNATLTERARRWRRLSTSGGSPPPRHDHTLVAGGERLYLFGGRATGAMADLWSYNVAGNTWTEISALVAPPARFGHNAIWDPTRSRMVVFGGQDGSTFFNDLWEFDPVARQWLDPLATVHIAALPSPRYGAGGCFDEAGHLVITHGFTTQGRFDDTWQYDLAAQSWTEVSPPEGDRPVERCLMRIAWDARKLRLFMFGGQTTATPFLDDLWGWSAGRGWSRLERTPKPPARNSYAMIADDQRAQVVLVGGNTKDGPVNDIWSFHTYGENWTQISTEGGPPAPRYGHDAAILAPAGPILVFGGTDGTTDFNDLWELSADD